MNQHTAYFIDGPMQGKRETFPHPPGRGIRVPLPEWSSPLRDEYGMPRIGEYRLVGRIGRDEFTYEWMGTVNRNTRDRIDFLIGNAPRELVFPIDRDEVIIDAYTFNRLLDLAERDLAFEVSASVDGEPLPCRLSVGESEPHSLTVDLPVRRAGQPHKLTLVQKRLAR